MASTYQSYDPTSYDEKLRRSIGPGMYQIARPSNDCGDACERDIPADPSIRYQQWGSGTCAPGSAVADESELFGLNYKKSKCMTDSYIPGKYKDKGVCAPSGKTGTRACAAPTEHTRLSNPPCTLHSTGWNRWEWLCYDPQERSLIPFEWNVSYRTVVKDNHTPILEQPLDQSGFVPGAGHGEIIPTTEEGHWTSKTVCNEYNRYVGDPFNASSFSCTGI